MTTGPVDALEPLRLTGTVTAPATAAARPTWLTVQVRKHRAWRTLHHTRLSWSGSRATFVDTIKDTSRPGRLAARIVLTPQPAVTLSRTVSANVKAVIDITVSGPLARTDLPSTYRAGCPVTPTHLRRIQMNYWSFDTGRLARGTLIARSSTVADLRAVFTRMFNGRFPIHKMVPVDVYKGSDVRSMAADNTSAFNCRSVTGNPYRVSQHSYGNAIDVNTYENPYVTSGRVYPSRHFLSRAPYRKGMILQARGGASCLQFCRVAVGRALESPGLSALLVQRRLIMAGDAARRRGLVMIGAPVFVAAVAVGLVIALALSSRSDDGTAAASPASSAAAASVTSSAAEPPSPTPSKPPSSEPAPPSAPATTSGGLTARTLPAARTLGAGWTSRVDNGSAEEGYVGNGTPTQARDPHEVVMTVVPLGCEQRSSLPIPDARAGGGLSARCARDVRRGSAPALRHVGRRRAVRRVPTSRPQGVRGAAGR